MKKLGVIGGMGPEASAYFYRLLSERAGAGADQDHPDMYILSLPSIPDRTEFIMGRSDKNPAPVIKKAALTLRGLGADVIAIPCVTAHYFYDDFKIEDTPIIHMIDETAAEARRRGIKTAGLLGTEGTLASGFASRIFDGHGIKTVSPRDINALSRLIYDMLKAGRRGGGDAEADALFAEILRDESFADAECIILACTELSLLSRENFRGTLFLDPLEILADRALALCGEG